MKIKPLLETYVTSATDLSSSKNEYPIFSFPLKDKEKRELLKGYDPKFSFRFIADGEKKKLYIFNYNIMHYIADRELKINKYSNVMNSKYIIDPVVYGYAIYKDGSFKPLSPASSSAIPREGFDFVWKYFKKR